MQRTGAVVGDPQFHEGVTYLLGDWVRGVPYFMMCLKFYDTGPTKLRSLELCDVCLPYLVPVPTSFFPNSAYEIIDLYLFPIFLLYSKTYNFISTV